ncbi:MAG: DUF4835 family protein [bacterium]|nr:DUF4835 family protein [bacterium]
MKRIKTLLSFTSLLIAFLCQAALGQNIKANVTVKLERLPHEKRIELQSFNDTIKNYLESTSWSDTRLPFDIEINVQILLERFTITYEDVYHARFFINSSTGYQESDKFWQFPYRKNQPLMHNVHLFDGLTGLIDFYMFIALGEEFDKFSPLGGDDFFRKALTVAQYGKSDIYNKYWNYREDSINKYLRESHKPFRAMTASTYAAVFYHLENNTEQAALFAKEVMKNLKEISKDYDEAEFLIDFFKREYRNLAPVILNYTEEYDILMNLDPEHKEFYRTVTKK